MTAANHNFRVDQGATFRAAVYVSTPEQKNEAGVVTTPSAPYDLTGFTGKLRTKREGQEQIVERNTVLNGNEINLFISDEDTQQMAFNGESINYFYEVLLLAPSGDTLKVIRGVITVIASFA